MTLAELPAERVRSFTVDGFVIEDRSPALAWPTWWQVGAAILLGAAGLLVLSGRSRPD
jgi:hypothetical protein